MRVKPEIMSKLGPMILSREFSLMTLIYHSDDLDLPVQ